MTMWDLSTQRKQEGDNPKQTSSLTYTQIGSNNYLEHCSGACADFGHNTPGLLKAQRSKQTTSLHKHRGKADCWAQWSKWRNASHMLQTSSPHTLRPEKVRGSSLYLGASGWLVQNDVIGCRRSQKQGKGGMVTKEKTRHKRKCVPYVHTCQVSPYLVSEKTLKSCGCRRCKT